MSSESGVRRMKVVWSVICVVCGIAFTFLGKYTPEYANTSTTNLGIGTMLVATAFAVAPFLRISFYSKALVMWLGFVAGAGWAKQDLEGTFALAVLGGACWLAIYAIGWIYGGFKSKD